MFFCFILFQINLLKSQVDTAYLKLIDKLFDNYYNAPQNNMDSELTYLDSALKIAKTHNYTIGITNVTREKGYVFSENGNYVKAMQLLFEALKLDDKTNNNKGIASDLNLIGQSYHQQEKLDDALTYFIKSRDKFTGLNDENGVAMVNGNLGMVYREINKFEQALKCYFFSREYYLKQKDEINISLLENNIGNVYKDLKQYDKALKYFTSAKEGKIKNKKYFSLVTTLSNIGDVYVEQKNYNNAIKYYNEALVFAQSQNSLMLQKDVYLDMSVLYSKQANYKKAYETFKKSTLLKDSIISDKYNNDIAELKVKYESDKKENENKVLVKDNELQSEKIKNEKKQKLLFAALSIIIMLVGVFVFIQYRTKQILNKQLEQINKQIKNQNNTLKILNKDLIDSEEKLTLSNITKDQLISMLSHDLFNPVTSLINYTNLILTSGNNKSNEELLDALIKINRAVVPLKDLLDNMLQWARSQRNNLQVNFEEVNLNAVIFEIISLYQPVANFKQIKIIYNPVTEVIANTDRLMISFILRNIINNAVKFSPKEKEINIETTNNKNSIVVDIKDEGIGFKNEIVNQLNNSLTKDLKGELNASGIGLSVSRRFIELLNGKIEFKNVNETGAEVIISLPPNRANRV